MEAHQGLEGVVPLVTGLDSCSLMALEASLVAHLVDVAVAQPLDVVEIQVVSYQVAQDHQEWGLVGKALLVEVLWVLMT